MPDTTSHPITDSAERTALKEWAVLVDAMARGDIVAMVRKGGIREQRAGFSVRHDRFLLYPTFFHEKVGELAPRFAAALPSAHDDRPPEGMLRLEYVADVAAVWHVTELERLRGIESAHGLAWDAVASRFHYRNNPGVRVVAVRLARLPHPVLLPEIRRYGGCVSWVELDEAVDVGGATPVVPVEEHARRVGVLRDVLGDPERGD